MVSGNRIPNIARLYRSGLVKERGCQARSYASAGGCGFQGLESAGEKDGLWKGKGNCLEGRFVFASAFSLGLAMQA